MLAFLLWLVATILTTSVLKHRKPSYLCVWNPFFITLDKVLWFDLICLVSMVIAVLRIYLISFYLFVLLILLGSSICILSIFLCLKEIAFEFISWFYGFWFYNHYTLNFLHMRGWCWAWTQGLVHYRQMAYCWASAPRSCFGGPGSKSYNQG